MESVDYIEMIIIYSQYSAKYEVLGFRFDTGATFFYGRGFVPGTDVPTCRFVISRGFKDKAEYRAAQVVARDYSRGLGFENVQGYFESFQGNVL